jgi:hypothetical protein
MRKPDESLDLVVEAAPEKLAEPPRPVSLRFTREIEVLKPLARSEGPAKSEEAAAVDTSVSPDAPRLSWFHRSLVAGGGLAMIAIILASAVFISTYDPPAEPAVSQIDTAGDPSEVAIDAQPVDTLLPAEEPPVSDIFVLAGSQPRAADSPKSKKTSQPAFRIPRSVFSSSARPRLQPPAYPPPPKPPPSPRLVPDFVPTTLVIYVEKGEIKTRIEPQLTAGKKQLNLPN